MFESIFTGWTIECSGYRFRCKAYLDTSIVVHCEHLMQTEQFGPGEGPVMLEEALNDLIGRILSDNGIDPEVKESGTDKTTSRSG